MPARRCVLHFFPCLCVLLTALLLPAQEKQDPPPPLRTELPAVEELMAELADEQPPLLRPGAREELIARNVTGILSRYHYTHPDFTAAVGERWYNAYFAALDPAKIYFSRKDIDEFRAYIPILGGRRAGYLNFPCAVYQRFLQRMLEQIRFCAVELDKQQDFGVEGEAMPLYTRNDDIPWCSDRAELETRWRQRVKNALLGEALREEEQSAKKTAAPEAGRREDVLTRQKRRLVSLYKMRREADLNQIMETFLNAGTTLFDPHSGYMAPASEEDFNMRMSLSLQGIGATLSIRDSYVTIMELVPGAPAKRSGRLHPGDRIVAVAQSADEEPVVVIDMALDKVVQKIRGPKGSEVFLTVMPAGSETEHVVRLVRDEIKMKDAAAQSTLHEISLPSGGSARVLQIYLPGFYRDFARRSPARSGGYTSATRDVRRLLREAAAGTHYDCVVLDLRGNGGGSLDEAVDLTGLFMPRNGFFMPRNPVVQIRDADDRVQTLYSGNMGAEYGGPLVVMVDRYSASASEIVAAALQDSGRAVVVGDVSTHGKGSVQTVLSMDNDPDVRSHSNFMGGESAGTLKLTTAKFYRINGDSTQERGVIPDIVFPSFAQYMDTNESNYPNVLPWDKISPVSGYSAAARLRMRDLVASLNAENRKYMAANAKFADYLKSVEEFRQQRGNKSIPLELSARRLYRDRENALLKKVQHYQPLRKSEVDEADRYHDEDEPQWHEDASMHEDVILDATLNVAAYLLEAVRAGR